MKKLIGILFSLLLVLSFTACDKQSMNYIIQNKPSVTCIVEEVHGSYFILYAENDAGNPNSCWIVTLSPENPDSYTDVAVGDEVVVYHDGNVMETYPLRIGTVYAITLKTPADRTANEQP